MGVKETVKWVKELRKKMYEDWKKDPLAYEKKQKEFANKLEKKYMAEQKK
ncbi:MAG: hypothetical protein AAF443_07915 [Chlamydiota bacterium]